MAPLRSAGSDCFSGLKRAGERINTNRRDAGTLAPLHLAGQLTGVWAGARSAHEAVRDLVRAREGAGDDLRPSAGNFFPSCSALSREVLEALSPARWRPWLRRRERQL